MTNHRDAITGQYVTADHAAANPDTTVSESPCTECERLRGIIHAQKVAIDGYREEVERLRAAEPIVRTVGDLTARHQLSRPRIRVAGREGMLKIAKPSDAYPGTLTLIWGDWWEDVALEEPCEVL